MEFPTKFSHPQRTASLMRFLQKRKDRCFDKKVRYDVHQKVSLMSVLSLLQESLFFLCSIAGCPFGEGCHNLHFVPGGYNVVSQMMNLKPAAPPINVAAPPPVSNNGSAPNAVKTRICNKFNSVEGCKFGDKCHFSHGEWELGKPFVPLIDDHRSMGPTTVNRMAGRTEAPFGLGAGSFGANSTAKVSVKASSAGAIIGKGGVNSKQICRQTGFKFSIRDHESDLNLRNIELEGTFDQIA